MNTYYHYTYLYILDYDYLLKNTITILTTKYNIELSSILIKIIIQESFQGNTQIKDIYI